MAMPASFTSSCAVKLEPFSEISRRAAWTICSARCTLRTRDACTVGDWSAIRSTHDDTGADAAGASSVPVMILISERLRTVDDGAAEMRRGMTRQTDRHAVALSVAGSSRQLQVALQHLRYSVHASVAQRSPARQYRQRAGKIAVDAAVPDEAVRVSGRAEAEALEPEPDEGREAVVQLRQLDVTRPHTGALPQPARHLG